MTQHHTSVRMGDIRFIMIGIVLIFVGFIILGIFGNEYRLATIEADEFGTCYRYLDNAEPVKVSCADKIAEQIALFGIVIIFIGSGIISLIKGVRGNWDSKVRPEDMVGPKNRDVATGGKDDDENQHDNSVDHKNNNNKKKYK